MGWKPILFPSHLPHLMDTSVVTVLTTHCCEAIRRLTTTRWEFLPLTWASQGTQGSALGTQTRNFITCSSSYLLPTF